MSAFIGHEADTQPREGAGVRLYDDADLVPLDVPHQGSVSRLVRDLLAAQSSRQRQRVVREELDSIGFNWMGYNTVRRSPDGELQRKSLTTYAPVGWMKRYYDHHYDEVDPRQAQMTNSSLPLVWDTESFSEKLDARPCCAKSRRFIKDLQDHGMCSGISFQISQPGAASGQRIVVSLVSDVDNRRWMGDQVLGDALIFGLSLHDYMAQHVLLPDNEPVKEERAGTEASNGLPALQKAVLGHVARGLTDRQIAERLNVSSHAVDYHLRQLRQRFAVRNRVQLVNAAANVAGMLPA